MGKIGDIIKKYVIKPITEHIISSIIVFVSIAFAGVWMTFKTWLAAEHNFNLAGWLWVLIFAATAAIAALPLLIFIAVTAKRKARGNAHLLTDHKDTIPILSRWFFEQSGKNEIIIVRYDQIDRECDFLPGTLKEHIAIFDGMNLNGGTVVNLLVVGEKTVTIQFIKPKIV